MLTRRDADGQRRPDASRERRFNNAVALKECVERINAVQIRPK